MDWKLGDIVPHEKIRQATDYVNTIGGGYYLDDYDYDENGNVRLIVCKVHDPTPEEIAERELKLAKYKRAEAVSKITVEVDGMVFDGDETSQLRVARSIIALEDGEMITWVLHDDTIAEVTKEQLKQVLRKAGQKQTELWTVPYTKQPNKQ